ncbi:hypothetical protein C8Q76DRAFT_262963 [Earliella scabrosa]|nr:hypothetical protein C8Q76DRAFT_262963 [Earliella scabrosa]
MRLISSGETTTSPPRIPLHWLRSFSFYGSDDPDLSAMATLFSSVSPSSSLCIEVGFVEWTQSLMADLESILHALPDRSPVTRISFHIDTCSPDSDLLLIIVELYTQSRKREPTIRLNLHNAVHKGHPYFWSALAAYPLFRHVEHIGWNITGECDRLSRDILPLMSALSSPPRLKTFSMAIRRGFLEDKVECYEPLLQTLEPFRALPEGPIPYAGLRTLCLYLDTIDERIGTLLSNVLASRTRPGTERVHLFLRVLQDPSLLAVFPISDAREHVDKCVFVDHVEESTVDSFGLCMKTEDYDLWPATFDSAWWEIPVVYGQ